MCGLTPVRVSFDYPLKLHHTQTRTATEIISERFDYPLKLHHTQTRMGENQPRLWFDYPLKLHHTQTNPLSVIPSALFDYPLKLHHTQTLSKVIIMTSRFDYPLKLHHTQTSNLKSEYFYAPHASIQRTECNYLYYSIKSYSDNDFAQIFVNQSDKFFVCFIFQSIFQKKETNILQLRLIVKTFQILFV